MNRGGRFRRRRLGAFLPVLILPLITVGPAADAAVRSMRVEGTEFRVDHDDGRVLTSRDLVGAILDMRIGDAVVPVRIDGVMADPMDPTGSILLHDFRVRDEATDVWQPLCQPDAQGRRLGFPLARPRNGGYALTCTAGAEGKCVRFGYRPWQAEPDGRSLAPYHEACIRMVRADYCGDGRAYTRDGTLIDLYDRLGIQRPEADSGLAFEAAWGPDGAACVHHMRVPANGSLDELAAACPRLAAAPMGPACQEDDFADRPDILLFNRSQNHSVGP
jgi:hypothetical protein